MHPWRASALRLTFDKWLTLVYVFLTGWSSRCGRVGFWDHHHKEQRRGTAAAVEETTWQQVFMVLAWCTSSLVKWPARWSPVGAWSTMVGACTLQYGPQWLYWQAGHREEVLEGTYILEGFGYRNSHGISRWRRHLLLLLVGVTIIETTDTHCVVRICGDKWWWTIG